MGDGGRSNKPVHHRERHALLTRQRQKVAPDVTYGPVDGQRSALESVGERAIDPSSKCVALSTEREQRRATTQLGERDDADEEFVFRLGIEPPCKLDRWLRFDPGRSRARSTVDLSLRANRLGRRPGIRASVHTSFNTALTPTKTQASLSAGPSAVAPVTVPQAANMNAPTSDHYGYTLLTTSALESQRQRKMSGRVASFAAYAAVIGVLEQVG